MLFADLRQCLKTSISAGYIMTGTDIFLVNKSVELILLASKIEPNNVVHLGEEANLNDITAHLLNVSMFGGATAVLIRGLDHTRLYLQRVKSDRELEKIDCNPMDESLVVRLIMQNKKFTQGAAVTLARACENNYAAISGEIEKLTAYKIDGEITENDVDEIVTKTEKYQIYELFNALLKRDRAKITTIIENLGSTGVDEYAVFGGLVAFARRLFYSKQSTRPDTEIAKHLGVNPYAITALRRDARHITPEQSTKIYENALEYEYQIKSGKILGNRAVILLVGEFL